jgi:hypothetical protein
MCVSAIPARVWFREFIYARLLIQFPHVQLNDVAGTWAHLQTGL